MSEAPIIALAVPGGFLLGVMFFGGLWWTVRKAVSSTHAAAWFLGSVLFRTAAVLVGFYFIAQGDWKRLVAALVGFFFARLFVALLSRTPVEKKSSAVRGEGL